MEQAFNWWQALAVFGINAGHAVLVGAMLSYLWLRASPDILAMYRPRLLTLGRSAWTVMLVSSLAALLGEAANMAELPLLQAWRAVPLIVTDTHYGRAWLAGFVTLLISSTLLQAQQSRLFALLGVAGLLGLTMAHSALGHAGAQDDGGRAWINNSAHMVAASIWTGSVIVSAWVAFRPLLPPVNAIAYASDLSKWATAALALILTTGVVNAWIPLSKGLSAVTTSYKFIVAAKLTLVVVAILMGAYNRFYTLPKLGQSDLACKRFVRVLQVESVVLLTVLVLASVLALTAPGLG